MTRWAAGDGPRSLPAPHGAGARFQSPGTCPPPKSPARKSWGGKGPAPARRPLRFLPQQEDGEPKAVASHLPSPRYSGWLGGLASTRNSGSKRRRGAFGWDCPPPCLPPSPDRGWREPRAARPLATLGVGAFPGQVHTGKVELAPDSAARSPVHFSHDRNKRLPIFCFGHLEGHFVLLAATRVQFTPLPPPRHTARRLQAPDPSDAYPQVLGQILSTKWIDSPFPKQKKYKLQ